MLFMWFVHLPADVVCERRRELARKYLEMDDEDLFSLISDMPYKLRRLFPSEFRVVAEVGKVPLNLFAFLLLWGMQLPAETQCVEGELLLCSSSL